MSAVAVFLALAPGLLASVPQTLEPALVRMDREDGVELWTVHAHEASIWTLLERVGELSGRAIDAQHARGRAPLVTVTLDRRPLEQVLEFALGSAGMRCELDLTHDDPARPSVRVRDDDSVGNRVAESAAERIGLAAAAWERVATRFPRHRSAATARLAQGELAQLRGQTETARERYLELLTHAPSSPPAAEAYLRAGRIAAERGDWREASEHFRALANLPEATEYRAVARAELARATLHLGDAASALHILEALDASHPSVERTERTARALVRIEALLELARFHDALAELDAATDLDPLGRRELPRLRARALEGAGLAEEASRAWLLVGREEADPARAGAYQAAVRVAEDAGDPLGVLFAANAARTAGFGAVTAAAEARARAALGIAEGHVDATPDAAARLEQAESWLAKRDHERARAELEPLFDQRDVLELAPELRARVVLGWARCLARSESVESAARCARTERERLESGPARAALDRGMASLFEEHGLFERAADAYRGDY